MSIYHGPEVRMDYDRKRDSALALKMLGLLGLGGLIALPVVGMWAFNVAESSFQSGGGITDRYIPALPPVPPVNVKQANQACAPGAPTPWLMCVQPAAAAPPAAPAQ